MVGGNRQAWRAESRGRRDRDWGHTLNTLTCLEKLPTPEFHPGREACGAFCLRGRGTRSPTKCVLQNLAKAVGRRKVAGGRKMCSGGVEKFRM